MKDFYLKVSFSFGVRVLAALSALMLTIFTTRKLGMEESGYYFLAFSLVATLSSLCRLGLDNAVVKEIGANKSHAAQTLKLSCILVGGVAGACFLFIFCMSEYIAIYVFQKIQMAKVLKNISGGILGLSLLTVLASTLQGMGRVILSVLISAVILNLLLVAVLIVVGPGGASFLAGIYSATSMSVFVFGLAVFLLFSPKVSVGDVNFKKLLSSSLPLLLVVLMQQLLQWSGQFIAGIQLDAEAVSRLASAQRTAMLVSFVLGVINLVVAPKFAELYSQNRIDDLKELSFKSVRLVSVLILPLIILVMFVPDLIMSLYGPEYREAGGVLRILAAGQFVNAITGSVGILLIMSGNEKDLRNITVVSGVIALTLVWGLTVFLGEVGNSLGTAIAVASQNLLAVYFVKKRLGFNSLLAFTKI